MVESICGLKQAAKDRYEELETLLIGHGSKRGKNQ